LIVTDVLALVPPWLVKGAIDALPSLSSAAQLLPYLLAIVAVVSFQALFRFSWRRALLGVSRRVEYRLRNDLFGHLQTMDRPFFLRHPVGDLMSRCTNDLVAIQEFIAYFGLMVVDSSLTIVMCLVLMSIIDPLLTVAAMLPMPFLSLSFLYFGRRLRRKSAEVQAELANLTQLVQESLAGIRVIQAYTLEKVRSMAYRQATEQYIERNLQLAAMRGIFYAVLTFLAGLSAIVVLWLGSARVLNGHITLGGFVAFNSYLTMLTWPMMSLGFMVNLYQRGRASLDRLDEVFRQRPSISSPSLPVDLGRLRGEIRFQGVRFRYPGSDRWALGGISFTIRPGEKIAITGPVGCGKSTLLELMPRIFDPTAGVIFLDGRDLRAYALGDLRRRVAWVAQEPFLFSDAIAENMRFGAPNQTIDKVGRVAGLVRLDKDRELFPHGWETVIGERGVMLSGGQRQRVALARAMMSDPRILLLDDAFAHLDEETESEVLRNILEVLPEATILFSSHRVSSLRRADRVVVLKEGRVFQEGPPEVLMQTPGYFQRICRQQELETALERFAHGERS
jgi:ATP-binding cassette subfamily B protein